MNKFIGIKPAIDGRLGERGNLIEARIDKVILENMWAGYTEKFRKIF